MALLLGTGSSSEIKDALGLRFLEYTFRNSISFHSLFPIRGMKADLKFEFDTNSARAIRASGERVTWKSLVKRSSEPGTEQRDWTKSGEAWNRAHRDASSAGGAVRPSERSRARRCHAFSDSAAEAAAVVRLRSESARPVSMELQI
jgi:hypothetical protein